MNILVLTAVKDYHKRLLETKAPNLKFIYANNQSVTTEEILNADAILGNPSADIIKNSKKLKWLQLQSAGAGAYINENVLPKGCVLTNASGAYGLAISEHMLAVVFELSKKLHRYRDNQLNSEWKSLGEVKGIYNSTALIIGLGDIGGELAKRLKALGAYTIGIRRTNTNKPDYLDELYLMEKLEEQLSRADIVALSLPGTKLTNNIINKDTLALMKSDAILVNVGRGTAIDTEALCDALEEKRLWGAALDVTDPEPLPKDHRLWSIENAVITPHISGGFSLQATHDKIIEIAADNLEAFLEGRELKNVVDLRAGY